MKKSVAVLVVNGTFSMGSKGEDEEEDSSIEIAACCSKGSTVVGFNCIASVGAAVVEGCCCPFGGE